MEEESHFIGMVLVVEFIVNWQPRRGTGNVCVYVGNLPMQVAYLADTFGLFFHIHSLGTN